MTDRKRGKHGLLKEKENNIHEDCFDEYAKNTFNSTVRIAGEC